MEAQVSVAKRAHGWVISVDGAELLTCNRRSVAMQMLRMLGTTISQPLHDDGDYAGELAESAAIN